MGSIRVLPATGNLFIDFRYKGSRCREYTALTDIPENRKKLTRFLKQIEREIKAGSFDYARHFPGSRGVERVMAASNDPPPTNVHGIAQAVNEVLNSRTPGVPTFGIFAATWAHECQITWRDSHRRTVDDILRLHLLPQFQNRLIDTILKADVLAFRAQLAELPGRGSEKLSPKRINAVMTTLGQILNEAADRYGFTSSFRNIHPLKVKKPDVEPFTLAETQRVIAAVQQAFRNYYTVRFFTGMRTGEIDGLLWKYVDFAGRQILIRETLVLGKLTKPKTEGSIREIHMSELVYQALKQQRGEGEPNPDSYVFCNANGNPLDHNNVTKRIWYPLLKSLRLKARRPYQTRHTCATLWLASGENPLWIAGQLGHTSTEMLFKVYGRFVPNLTRQDGSAFERLLMQSQLTQDVGTDAMAANESNNAPNKHAAGTTGEARSADHE